MFRINNIYVPVADTVTTLLELINYKGFLLHERAMHSDSCKQLTVMNSEHSDLNFFLYLIKWFTESKTF
jgi:hypothetical protein